MSNILRRRMPLQEKVVGTGIKGEDTPAQVKVSPDFGDRIAPDSSTE